MLTKRKLSLLVIILIFLFAFTVNATNVQFSNVGLEIDYPKFDSIIVNNPFNLSINAYNVTDGLEITNANCTLHLENQTGQTIFFSNLTRVGSFYQINIPGFNNTGIYHFNLYCNTSVIGGFASGLIEVTNNGFVLDTGDALGYIILLLLSLTIFFICLYFAITIKVSNERDEKGEILSINKLKYIKLILIPISYALFIWVLNLSIGIASTLNITIYYGALSFVFLLLSKLAYVFFLIWSLIFIKVLYNDLKLKEAIDKGSLEEF